MSWLREPLVHFLGLGALVLGVQLALGEAREEPPEASAVEVAPIVVSDGLLADLRGRQRAQRGREPTDAEVAAAVEAWLDDEVLVREARRLGLDRDDPVVRSRLAQKMALVSQGAVVPPEPSDDDLRPLYDPQAFTVAGRLTLRHVFAPDRAAAEVLLARWQAGEDPRTLGDPPPGGPVLRSRTPARLTERHGAAFAEGVAALAIGERALVGSDEGWHGVELLERVPGRQLSFDEARARLRLQWQTAAVAEAHVGAVQGLRERAVVQGWPR